MGIDTTEGYVSGPHGDSELDTLRKEIGLQNQHVQELWTRYEGLASVVDALEERIGPGDADVQSDAPKFPSLRAWVNNYYCPMFVRQLGGEWRWCSQWWDHAEAVLRLASLWHSWEALHHQPGTGLATWLTHHLDPQMPILMGSNGPFNRCSAGMDGSTARHTRNTPLLADPPPPDDPVRAGEN